VLSPATLTIIITTFQGEKLPRALGAWSAVAAAGGAVGGLLGGILTGWVSWRWVFFINVPLGIFALVIAGLYLREMRNKDATVKLDITGAALVTLSLFAFVYGIVHSSDVGLTSAVTLAWTGGGLAGIGLFAWWESQVASHPLIPFAVFRSSSLAVASVVMFFTGCAFFILWYFLTFYLQVVLQYGAVKAGFSFLPLAVAIIAGAQIAARKMSTTGTRPFIIGASALSAIGFWWLGHLHATGPYWSCVLLPGCLVTFAMGLMFSPLAATATWGIDRAEAGLASGVVNAARQLGGAMSLAVLGTVATDHTKSLITLSPADASVAGWNLGYQITAGILVVALLVALTLDPQVGKRTL
jgi:predicted MFS family arabinose efflux permease